MQPRYSFGPFVLEPRQRRLLKEGEPLRLPPRVFDALTELVENGGRLVSKHQLLERVWNGKIVEEGSLGRTISHLRSALGAPGYIETVSKHGYRFAAPVRYDVVSGARCLAILPLVTWGAEAALGIGIADSLITGLSSAPGLEVRPTSAVVRFTDCRRQALAVGRQLGADLILDGRLTATTSELRATLQLLPIDGAKALWAGTITGSQQDIFSFQDRLLAELGRALGVAVAPEPAQTSRTDPAVYRLYLQGRYHSYRFDRASSERSLSCFRAAIEQDPEFAPAYAGLSAAALIAADFYLPAHQLIPEGRCAAENAIRLDPGLAEAHASLGMIRFWSDWEREAAGDCFELAVRLGPGDSRSHHVFAWYLTAMGRLATASRHFETAFELDPLSSPLAIDRGLPHYFAGRFEQAAAVFREGIELDEGSWYGHYRLGQALLGVGQLDNAGVVLRVADDRAQGAIAEIGASMACGEALAGRADAARRRLTRLLSEGQLNGFDAAIVHLTLGDPGAALDELERAIRDRHKWVGWLAADPRLDSLRSDDRFGRLLVRAGFSGSAGRTLAESTAADPG